MWIAPLGAWFADDPEQAVRQATRAATVTDTHPEAIAVAVRLGEMPAGEFLDQVVAYTPPSLVRDGIVEARRLLTLSDPVQVVRELGNGRQVSAQDTVPFTLWVAARHRGDFQRAFWATASAGGDVDTTCAIGGGILGSRSAPPQDWLDSCEPLPRWAAGRR